MATYKSRIIRAFRCILDDLNVKEVIGDGRKKQIQDILDGITPDEEATGKRDKVTRLMKLLERSKCYVAAGWREQGETEECVAYDLLESIKAELK